MGAAARRPGDGAGRRDRASRGVLRAACVRTCCPATMRAFAPPSPTTARSPTGSRATCIRTRCRATRSSRCRSRRPACRRAMRRPTRWTPIADLADRYSFGELRVSHEQNLIFADVRQAELLALWQQLKALGFATPNIGLLTNIVCCPGGDFCSLANAKSIPIAEAIQRRFDDLDYLHDIGELDLNISGCMNACGHHHVGHIGMLGVDKNGSEWYQVTIGGTQGEHAAIGKVIGPSFAARRNARRHRAADRDVRRHPARGRALRRHRAPRRHRPLQGARLCRSSLGAARSSTDACTLVREAGSLADLPEATPVIVPLALWTQRARRADRARRRRRVARAGRRSGGARRRRRVLPVIAIDFPEVHRRPRLLDRRACCASATAIAASCARSATSSATSSTTCAQVGFDAFALRDGKDAGDALRASAISPTATRSPQSRTPWFRRAWRQRRPATRGGAPNDAGATHRRRGRGPRARSPPRMRRPCSRAASAPRTWC